jgi:hypothetical protein
MFLGRAVQGASEFLTGLLDSFQRFSGAFLAFALTADEKSRLTVRIYRSHPGYMKIANRLYVWEQTWFQRRLPRPPAGILVGACGTGREAVALTEQGFHVDAFDPASEFVAESRRRLGHRARVWKFSYEDLSAFVLEGSSIPEPGSVSLSRYDAVLLGCGSLTHVLDPTEQVRLLRSLDILCPHGPILASFLCADEVPTEPRLGRAARLGLAMGRKVAKLRGIPSEDSPRESYAQYTGFAHTFSPHEIETLGRAINRQVEWEPDETEGGHATFLPCNTGVDR